jgi:hypothetical protein
MHSRLFLNTFGKITVAWYKHNLTKRRWNLVKKRMEARNGVPKKKRNPVLTKEERINSALLYTPELYTWTDRNNK